MKSIPSSAMAMLILLILAVVGVVQTQNLMLALSNDPPSLSSTRSVSSAQASLLTPNPFIEIANQSGVSGYEIGIFGSGFGTVQGNGNVTILGNQAQIVEWSDGFIRAVVPLVADGSGQLVVTTDSLNQDSSPFTVYTIAPTFQERPQVQFQNILHGRQAYLSGLTSYVCYQQPENTDLAPEWFLADFTCGYQNIVGTGKATFTAPATIAFDVSEGLVGPYHLQLYSESIWYDFYSVVQDYQIQVSADSTDGMDGSWTTLSTITGNNRGSRLHEISIPSGGYHWLRLHVTTGQGIGNQFDMKEIRLYQPSGGPSTLHDAFALYGDSLTTYAFEAIGRSGLAAKLKTLRNTSDDLIFNVYGLPGQSSFGLIDFVDSNVDIYDAFALDDMINRSTYWGIALGTNDTFEGSNALGVPGTNLEEYDNRVDAVVQHLISQGRVPLIARMPDTIESLGGFGDLASKKKILADIDAISALHRLIPGPDLYTEFRRNIETDNGSYYSGDGTHHNDAGEVALVDLWTSALFQGTVTTNQAPTAVADSGITDEDVSITVDVLANDSDADGDSLTIVNLLQPANGAALLNIDDTITYTPTISFSGSDLFTYTVDDGNGGQASAQVTVTVNEAPNPPGQVALLAPIGHINTPNPTFIWEAESSAISYTLVIYNVDNVTILLMDTLPAADNCTSTQCTFQPPNFALPPGQYTWLVQAVNQAGVGLWSVG
ncbi:MAG: cadherin-like domain-containing protein [Chloroflexota bacterium]